MSFRKTAFVIILFSLVILLFARCEKKQPLEITLPEGKKAEIIFLVGKVFVSSDAGTWIEAKVGDILSEGTRIRTDIDSYCEIVINSGTIFRMKDRSELQLVMLPSDEKRNKSHVHLIAGELFSKIHRITYRGDDTVSTSTSTLGVRGTEYLVRARGENEAGYSEVLVLQGSVRVRLNVGEVAKEEIPSSLRSVYRKISRGVNVREGYKLRVTETKVSGIEDALGEILTQEITDEARISSLKQQVALAPEPLTERDKRELQEMEDLTLSFTSGETYNISPNFDGIDDEFVFSPGLLVNEKVLEWKLVILDVHSRVRRTINSRRVEEGNHVQIPEHITWNMDDQSGGTVPDGDYVYEFYTYGKSGRAVLRIKGRIVVDTLPPELTVSTDEKLFSPNGDNVKDTVVIQIEAEPNIDWNCVITTPEGITVKSIEWGSDIPEVFEWDGRGDNGSILPEGVYNIFISGHDKAGNVTTQIVEGVTLDVRERSASVDVDYPIFSPNGDGKLDTVTFFPYLSDRNRIDTWDLIVQTEKGETARRFRGLRWIPDAIVWDGIPQKGTTYDSLPGDLPSGKYFYFLKVIYRSGVNTFSFKKELILDKEPPQVNVEVSPEIFSPDGDGENELLAIRPKISDLTPILFWRAVIFTKNGTVFKTISGSRLPGAEILWDGVSDTGQLVDSGEDYFLVLEATDSALNKGVSEKIPISVDILVIPTERGLKIRVSNIEFGFNTANLEGEKTFTLLRRGVEVLKKYGRYKIIIEGHTDSTGDENYNLVLSEKRAESVGRFLIENGIDANRLSFKGYGSQYPIDTNTTPEGRARNRRVEFILEKVK
jgi:outer membrane protein OmpA-like peptidoglycan-associated protein/flagellar hook assembly protein FlgD